MESARFATLADRLKHRFAHTCPVMRRETKACGYHLLTMAHMSNRDRIARAAAEAEAAAAEKAAKKATKKTSGSRPERAAKPVRVKVVWEVRNEAGKAVRTFPYPDKAHAESAVAGLTKSSGRPHVLREARVPME